MVDVGTMSDDLLCQGAWWIEDSQRVQIRAHQITLCSSLLLSMLMQLLAQSIAAQRQLPQCLHPDELHAGRE